MRGQSIDDRVVVIFPGALGDLLLALPALRGLRRRHQAATLIAAVREPVRALLAHTGIADATVSLDAADAAGLGGGARLPTWLGGRPCVYSWLGARDAGIRARIGDAAAAACFAPVEREPEGVHAAVAYAAAVGFRASRRTLAATAGLDPRPSAAADRLLGSTPAPVLVVHPGAGARGKCWARAGFAALAAWWAGRGGSVVMLAGPAEEGTPPLPGTVEIRDWPLPDVAAVLARAAGYVGNDSGVSHLAGALGVRGVVLFGPTVPARWRPLDRRLGALRATRWTPEGIPLDGLPVRRVIAACRRRFTLTRGDLDTSVHASSLTGRLARRFK